MRVSLESDNILVHLSVAATLVVFSAVTIIPAWSLLPVGFMPFVAFMVALFLGYNWGLKILERFLTRYLWGQSGDLLEELMEDEEEKRKRHITKESLRLATQMKKEKVNVTVPPGFGFSLASEGGRKQKNEGVKMVSIVDDKEVDQDLVRRRMKAAETQWQKEVEKDKETDAQQETPSSEEGVHMREKESELPEENAEQTPTQVIEEAEHNQEGKEDEDTKDKQD